MAEVPNVCGRWYGVVNVGKMFPSIVLGGLAFVGEGRGTLRSRPLILELIQRLDSTYYFVKDKTSALIQEKIIEIDPSRALLNKSSQA